MNEVRLGVIGIGNMGSEHCRTILAGKVPSLRITAVADRREDRRAWAKETFPDNTAIFGEGDELIASGLCDAVLIATPHYQHPTLAIKAFENGLDVLSEKPIGVYTKEVRREIAAAEKSGRVFALMFNQRTNCVYRKMREIIKSGELGAIKRVNWTITDWYRTQRYYDSGSWRATWAGEGGGVLINQCPHQLDLLWWLFGMPTRIRAFCHIGKWHKIEVEDDVTAYMEFPSGATGVFITSTADLPGVNRLEATFDRGTIICDGSKLELWRIPVSEREFCFTSEDAFGVIEKTHEEVKTDGENPQHLGVLRAFTEHLINGAPLIAEGAEGINSLMISNAMYLSSWEGREVTLPIDEDEFLKLLDEKRSNSKLKETKDITYRTDHSFGGQILPEEKA